GAAERDPPLSREQTPRRGRRTRVRGAGGVRVAARAHLQVPRPAPGAPRPSRVLALRLPAHGRSRPPRAPREGLPLVRGHPGGSRRTAVRRPGALFPGAVRPDRDLHRRSPPGARPARVRQPAAAPARTRPGRSPRARLLRLHTRAPAAVPFARDGTEQRPGRAPCPTSSASAPSTTTPPPRSSPTAGA